MDWIESLDWNAIAVSDTRRALIILVLVGLLYTFAGHRLIRLVICITGFLLAAVSAGFAAGWLSQGHPWIMAGAALVGGICGAMALFFLYRAGIFALGGLGSAIVLHGVLSGRPEAWVPWAILAGGIAGGLLAILAERPVMVLATAAIGAWMVTYAGAFLLMGEELSKALAEGGDSLAPLALLGSWAVLAMLGVGFQFYTRRRKRRLVDAVR